MATNPLAVEQPVSNQDRAHSQAARAGKESFYRPELDVVRFVAFFLVLVHHTMPFAAYGNWSPSPLAQLLLHRLQLAAGFGLCVFFCLSAYLIATLLLRERDLTGDVSLKNFYTRRVLRIWPLYLAVLLAAFVRSRMDGEPRAAVLLFFLLLAGNWYSGIYGFATNPITALWSISVEEQFYLFIPFFAKRGGRRLLAMVAGALFALFLVALGVLVHLHARRETAIWTNSLVQFNSFAAGLALALVLHRHPPPGISRVRQGLVLMVAVTLLAGASVVLNIREAGPANSWADLAAGYTAVSVGSAIFIYGFIAGPWNPPRILVYLGKISYGLSVFHSTTNALAKRTAQRWFSSSAIDSIPYFATVLAIAFLLALLAASLSYRFLEKPFLRLKDRFAVIHSRPV